MMEMNFWIFLTCVVSYFLVTAGQVNTFTIRTDELGPSIPDEFLSVTIDASLAQHFENFDFSSPLVNTLATGISPVYFRYGGTSEDETGYNTNGTITSVSTTDYTLNMTEFSMLADFAESNNWKFIFGLNLQERFSNNTWNPENSKDLMENIIQSGRDNLVIGYELGNEPDLYDRHSDFMNVTAQQNAKDFVTLYNLINNDVYKNSNYKPLIWGCDVASSFDYLQDWVEHSSSDMIDGVTWHHYYGDGSKWTLSDFISVSNLDSLIKKLNESYYITKMLSANSLDILGETSSTYGGGTANLSSSFVAGFVWLDKLGLSSIYSLYVVARQDFWGGNYGLIGMNKDFNPNPDYWSSYIFKNLIGNNVLYVNNEFDYGRNIRVYSFCTRDKNSNSIFNYNKGDISVMILNLQNNTINVNLTLNSGNINSNNKYDLYLLTSYPNVINSRDIFLNGKVLKMIDDTTFPEIVPVTTDGGSVIKMDALSYGFVVIVNANISVCM